MKTVCDICFWSCSFLYILILIGWNFFDLKAISIRYKFFDALVWVSAILLLGQIVFLFIGIGLAEKWWK